MLHYRKLKKLRATTRFRMTCRYLATCKFDESVCILTSPNVHHEFPTFLTPTTTFSFQFRRIILQKKKKFRSQFAMTRGAKDPRIPPAPCALHLEHLPASNGSIHRLPVEILAEIFLFCLIPKTLPLSSLPSVCSSRAPLLLCHVCSSWRRVALQTPALWTTFTIEVFPEDTLVVPERHSEAASCWFSRSKCHLIDLEIGQYAFIHPEECGDILL